MGNHGCKLAVMELGDGFTEWIEVALCGATEESCPDLVLQAAQKRESGGGKQNNVDKAQKSSIQDLEGKLCPVL